MIRNPVLVVIDMQKGFINGNSSYIIPNVVRLIHECQELSLPVVFTRFLNTEGSPFDTIMNWKGLSDEPETDLVDELVPFAELVMDKYLYSLYTDEFIKLADEKKWETIILCGVATESCVMKTAMDTFERHLCPIVVSDACGSDRGHENHQAGLLVLRRFIGKDQIMTIGDLLDRLDRSDASG